MLSRNKISRKGFRILVISLLSLISFLTQAGNLNLNQPSISIIIDDMGYRLQSGNRAVNLPGALTYSFLPHTPHAIALSQYANQKNKEIMLHLPMQAESGKKLGPGGLTENMTEQRFSEVLADSILSIPHVKGFNNHMGSLLTKNQHWMRLLMQDIASKNNLFFVDSKTTSKSIALAVAHAEGVSGIQRDIFIDHEESKEFIERQLAKLIKRAKRKGTALAIAHPKNITLSILEEWLPKLKVHGIKLVSVSQLIDLQKQNKLAVLNKTIAVQRDRN